MTEKKKDFPAQDEARLLNLLPLRVNEKGPCKCSSGVRKRVSRRYLAPSSVEKHPGTFYVIPKVN